MDIANTPTLTGIDLEAATAQFFEAAEGRLSSISGHDPKEAALHAGRGAGPAFKWVCAGGPIAQVRPRTTPLSQAWRRIAGWLRRLGLIDERLERLSAYDGETRAGSVGPRPGGDSGPSRRQLQMEAHGIEWRVLFYDHRVRHDASEVTALEYLGLSQFRDSLTWEALRCRAAVAMLQGVAEDTAARLETNALRRSIAESISWLHEGPAGGLGRQHRM